MALKESDKKALGLLSLALVGGVIYMGIIPLYEEHEKRLQEIDKLVGELRVAHRKAENMGDLVRDVELLKYRLADLKKVLPSDQGSFELIEKLQGLAARTGVRIRQIAIEERPDKGEGWRAEGLRINFTGYWFQYIEFLWKLENYERLIDVTSMRIGPEPLEPGVKMQRFSFEITANIYSSTISET